METKVILKTLNIEDFDRDSGIDICEKITTISEYTEDQRIAFEARPQLGDVTRTLVRIHESTSFKVHHLFYFDPFKILIHYVD